MYEMIFVCVCVCVRIDLYDNVYVCVHVGM